MIVDQTPPPAAHVQSVEFIRVCFYDRIRRISALAYYCFVIRRIESLEGKGLQNYTIQTVSRTIQYRHFLYNLTQYLPHVNSFTESKDN